jgi:autotransporter translocation and assembly factor TamB
MTEGHDNQPQTKVRDGNPRLRRLRRRLLLFFVTVLLAVGLFIGALDSGMGGDAIVSLLNRALEQSGGGELRADIRVDLLAGSLHARDFSLDLGKRGLVIIDSVSVVVKPFQLLRNRIIINEITVERPVVQLDLTTLSENKAGEPFDLTQLLDLPFDLVVHHVQIGAGEVMIDTGGEAPSELRGIAIRSDYQDGGYRFSLETGSGRVVFPGVEVPINLVTAEASLKDGDLNLLAFNLFLQQVSLSAKGSSTKMGMGDSEVEVNLELPLARLSDTVSGLPEMSGMAKLTARLSATEGEPRARGTLALTNASIGKQKLENVDLVFELTRSGLRLDDSVFHVGAGTVRFTQATMLFKSGFPTSAELELDNVELARILANLAHLDSHTSQYNSGRVTISGTLNPVQFDGFADIAVKDHRTHTVGMSQRRGRQTEIVHVPLGYVKSPISVTDRYFQFHDGKVFVGNSIIDIAFTRIGFDQVFLFEYHSSQFDFADANELLTMPVRGTGSLGVVINVDRGYTTIEGGLDVRDFSIQGFQIGELKSLIRYQPSELSFQDMRMKQGESVYHGRMAFDFSRTPLFMGVDFSTDGMRLEDLFTVIGYRDVLTPVFTGRLVGNGTFYGPIGQFSGSARLVLPEFSSPYQTMQLGRIEATLENNHLRLDKVVFSGESGHLKISGSLHDWRDLDLRMKAEGWDLNQIDFVRKLFGEDVQGGADLNGQVVGTLFDPVFQASLFLNDTILQGGAVEPSEIHLEWSKEHLDLKGRLFGKHGRYSVVYQFLPQPVLNLTVDLAAFPYTLAISHFLDLDMEAGEIDLHASAVIPMQNPRMASGMADITRITLKQKGVAVENDKPARVLLGKGVFKVEPMRLTGKGFAADLRGDIDMNGNLSIALVGRLDWRLLAMLIDSLQEAQGMLDVDLHVGGSWGKPALTGRAVFKQTRLKFAAIDTPLDNVRGAILMDVNRVEVEDLSFGFGGGQMSISGFTGLTLPEMEPDDVNLRVEVSRVGIELQHGFVPVLSGRLAVSGKPWPLLVQGKLRVDEAVYSRHIRWQKRFIMDRIMNLVRPKRARRTQVETPRFKFNVEINAPGTFEIRNNLARLELTADLLLAGTDIETGLLNTVSANNGSIFFLQNEFEVSRFMIEFERPDTIYPRFDIYGETRVSYIENDVRKDVRIFLSLLGTLEDTEIIMGSDAGLSQTDIVTLLVTGQPASALEGTAGVATGLNALSALYGVNDQIRTKFKLDEFRLTSSYTSAGNTGSGLQLVPKLVIGKEIADDIFITYTTTIGDTADRQDQRFEVRYRFDPFIISGEWDNDSTLQHGNFGTDLTFHIDF